MRKLIFLLCAVTIAAFGLTAATPPADLIDSLEGSAKLDALLARVAEQQRSLQSLSADFVQLKRSELLLEEVESRGEFFFQAPDKVRWDYRKPDEMVVVFFEDTVTTYHPEQSRAELLKISKKQRRFVRVLAGTQPLDDLMSNFDMRFVDREGDDHYYLTLRPTSAMVKKKLHSVEIEIDRELFLPVIIEYNEADGDTTRYEFRNLVLNPPIDDSQFRLQFGAGVKLQTIDASAGVG